MVLANVLSQMGITIGNDALTTTVDVLITVGGGLIVWIRHLSLKKQQLGSANVNLFGGVKKSN